MIYFVGNRQLIENDLYKIVDKEDCLRALKENKIIQLDTETTGFDPHLNKLLCVQFGIGEDQYVVDCNAIDIGYFKEILEDHRKLFILHNAKFDLRFLIHHNIFVKNIYDTFLGECILTTGYESRDLSLADVAKKYCAVIIDKTVRGDIHYLGLTSKVIEYAATDVMYLETIMNSQVEKIKKHQLEEVCRLEMDACKVFARIEYNGVKLDAKKWLEIAELVKEQTSNLQKELDNIINQDDKFVAFRSKYTQLNLFGFEFRELDINWKSNVQKLTILKTIDKNIEDTGERTLQKNKRKHPIFNKLLEYSKSAKLETAFGEKFLNYINPETGRIHYNVWQILSTGRISVSEPNLNQIPSKGTLGKEIRSCFVAPEGYKIVGGDFSGMELRLIAEFSKDPLWINAFNEGKDLHAVLCSQTFNIDIKDVKNESHLKPGVTYRDIQKTINFGLAYGMSEYKLSDTLDIKVEEARKIIDSFFKIVPEVNKFLTKLGTYGKTNGLIKTSKPFCRIRWFPKWELTKDVDNPDSFAILGEIERASKNMPIQGSNGDIIKLALIKIQTLIDDNELPVKILLSVYDEIQTECREDFAEEWKNILDATMKEAAQVIIKSIPIEVDCKIADCWTK
jgi:DNA polymerase-1